MENMTHSREEKALAFTDQGEGTPILLLHGLGSSRHEWDSLTPALTGAGYRVLACDLLGHGDSPKPADQRQYRLETTYETLDRWIDSLHLRELFFLGGHSLGGYLSLMFALRGPARLRGLALIDPFYSLEQIPPPLNRLTGLLLIGEKILHATPEKVLLRAMKNPFIHSSVLPLKSRQQGAIDIRTADPNVARIMQSIPSLLPQVEKIQLPALVVWGDRDRTCNPRLFPKLTARLPHAQGFCLPDCGHHPHLEKPEEVSQMILTFLNSI